MSAYNANILGSGSYFYRHRCQLEDLMEAEGAASMWFTFSAADNHWPDLFKLLDIETPKDSGEDEEKAAKFRRKVIREYPHIVDAFFYERFETCEYLPVALEGRTHT